MLVYTILPNVSIREGRTERLHAYFKQERGEATRERRREESREEMLQLNKVLILVS